MTKRVDRTYRFLAAQHIRRQAKQLAEQLDGLRSAEDVEFIHRARVASRRLRAALKMFPDCFGAKKLKRWRKQIRRITEGLGDARDKDVQIEFLCGVLSAVTDKTCFPGISRLLVQLEQERERLQPTVVKAANRLAASKVLEEMQAVTKGVVAEVKGLEPGDYSDFARAQTRQHILRRLEEMLPYEDSLQDPEDRRRHHAMRIAAKRLRYTVEIAKPVYVPELDAIITAVKKVQTLLGDIHDCDVWLEHLDAFAAAERRRVVGLFGHAGRFARLEAGINYLRQERHHRRQQVFQELVDYWRQLRGQGFWGNLVQLVQSADGRPVGLPAAASTAAAAASPPAGPAPAGSSSGPLRPEGSNGSKPNGVEGPHEVLLLPRAVQPPAGVSLPPLAAAGPVRREGETFAR
jgi:CHAD domain-containing protein